MEWILMTVSCFNCSILFPSGSILHSHLHECSKQSSRKEPPFQVEGSMPVQIQTSLPDDRDYLLGPYDTGLTVYPSVMNSDSSQVPVKNPTARDIILARKARLGNLMEISALAAYPLHIDESDKLYRYCPSHYLWPLNQTGVKPSTCWGITTQWRHIYGTSETACRLSAVVDEFDIWGEKDRWMAISLKEGWDESMEWPLYHIPSGYSVFVIYRHIPRTFCRPIQYGAECRELERW
jgi:hypothetical protein